MFKNKNTIKICSSHLEHRTPLIRTFAFRGAEYWCPYCGKAEGMMGAGMNVQWSFRLNNKLTDYTKKSRNYLFAKSILGCSETKYKGKWIKPSELPERSKQYYKRVIKSWKYKG